MNFLLILTAILAGLVQGTTGFGLGIVMMLVLPIFYPLSAAAAVVNFISLPLCFMMYFKYRKSVDYGLLFFPALFYILGSSLAILAIPYINQQLLKILFSIFLIILSIYFLKYASSFKMKANFRNMIITGVLSGICDGLFGIGGPLMVVFYLSLTKTKEAYLGLIQALFFIAGTYNLLLRIYRGIFSFDLLSISGMTVLAVLLGMVIAHQVVDRIDQKLMRQLTYGLIGVSGVITLITSIFF